MLGLRLFDILILIVLYASFYPDVDYCMTPDLIDRVEFIAIIVPSSGRICAKNFSASFCSTSQIPFMSWRHAALIVTEIHNLKKLEERRSYIAGKYRISAFLSCFTLPSLARKCQLSDHFQLPERILSLLSYPAFNTSSHFRYKRHTYMQLHL